MQPIILTRKELYDLVWSKPITQLAKSYSVPASFLRKVCKKNNIPLPANGYWSKLKFNKPVVITEMPNLDEYDLAVEINYQPKHGSQAQTSQTENLSEIVDMDKSLFMVPKRLQNPLPEIKKMKEEMEKHTPWDGWVTSYRDTFDAKISPENLNRALCILNTLLKIFHSLGYQIQNSRETYLIYENVSILASLREPRKKKMITSKSNSGDRPEFIPTGKLVLSFGRYSWKQEFKETKIPLEKQIPDIINYIILRFKKEVQERLDWEERKRIRKEEERKQKEIQKRIEEEFQKLIVLRNRASLWKEAQNIRSYALAMESQPDVTQEYQEYITWAKHKADWLNPLNEQSDEFLSEDYKVKFLEYLIKGNR